MFLCEKLPCGLTGTLKYTALQKIRLLVSSLGATVVLIADMAVAFAALTIGNTLITSDGARTSLVPHVLQ